MAGIPSGSRVLPAVISEDRILLGAELKDGTRIRGQYDISHPQPKQQQRRHKQVKKGFGDSISSLHSSPISRITYLLHDPAWRKLSRNQSTDIVQQQWSDRNVISPEPNPLLLDAISNGNLIVYGCGSLFTSVLPSLILEGVGSAISSRRVPKVLLLNGWHDQETSFAAHNDDGELVVNQMDATSIVQAVVDALNQYENREEDHPITDYVTHLCYPHGTEISIDEQLLADDGLRLKEIESIPANSCSEGSRSGGQSHHPVFDPRALVDELLCLAASREEIS